MCKLKVCFSSVVLPSLFLLSQLPPQGLACLRHLSQSEPLLLEAPALIGRHMEGAPHLGTWLCPGLLLLLDGQLALCCQETISRLWLRIWSRENEHWEPRVYALLVITAVCECYGCSQLAGWGSSSLSFFHLFSVTVSTTCEKLGKARNELQIAYEGFVQKLNQQHQTDLTELENRLKEFYTGECEKLQNIYIEEAEKYKTQLQEQVCTFRTWACAWPLLLISILTVVWWGSSFDDLLWMSLDEFLYNLNKWNSLSKIFYDRSNVYMSSERPK